MDLNKFHVGGLAIAIVFAIFTAGFYSRGLAGEAQLLKFNKSSAAVTPITTTVKTTAVPVFSTIKSVAPIATPVVTPAPTTSNNSSSANTSLWNRVRDISGQYYTELPNNSLRDIYNFCRALDANIPNAGGGVAKLAFQASDGKYYCINSNGSAGGLCGNGTASDCRSSGCCGSCLGGVLPPGVNNIWELSNLIFVPDSIITAIKQTVR